MQHRLSLEQMLQLIADGAARVLAVPRVSVRLLDASQAQLVAVARAGAPFHDKPVQFRLGEGLIGWIAQHGEPIRVASAEADPRFAPREGMTGALGAFVGVPLIAGRDCMGVISAVAGEGTFTAEHEALMILIAAMSAPHVEIARLSRLTQVDPLTGSLNRRGLDEHFPEVEILQGEVVEPLSVVMVDIDLFKQINDEHGHAVGDVVLKHVANILSRVLRAGDAVVRVGGEEFLLVLPGVDLARAAAVAERARAAVEAHPTPIDEARIESSVSMGVAQRGPAETRDAVIARADEALYRAKLAGRNQVVAATPERRDDD